MFFHSVKLFSFRQVRIVGWIDNTSSVEIQSIWRLFQSELKRSVNLPTRSDERCVYFAASLFRDEARLLKACRSLLHVGALERVQYLLTHYRRDSLISYTVKQKLRYLS